MTPPAVTYTPLTQAETDTPSFQGLFSESHTHFGLHTAVRRAGEHGLHTHVPCSAREGL